MACALVGLGAACSRSVAASGWAEQAVPVPGVPSGQLSAVSCTSSNACIAVGWTGTGSLAERWDGNAWTILTVPLPTGATKSELDAVSCASVSVCVAVGSYTVSPSPFRLATGGWKPATVFAERWNGFRWTVQVPPDPTEASSNGADQDGRSCAGPYRQALRESLLNAVSCTLATACTAVGAVGLAAGAFPGGGLIERWNGSSWSRQTAANWSTISLTGVSCPSVNDCFAVGSTEGSATVVERWNGVSWRVQRSSVANCALCTFTGLDGVSCSSASVCTAVGTNIYGGSNNVGAAMLSESWNGSHWSIQHPAPLAGPPCASNVGECAQTLQSVSCPSGSACIAVGFRAVENDIATAERWSRSRWSPQTIPSPLVPATAEFDGVSCAAATACTAVGQYTDMNGNTAALAERWDGTVWSIQSTPTTLSGPLTAVSCPATTACIAIQARPSQPGKGAFGRSKPQCRWR